ncbi:hypothetical protein PR048_006443 [Dryococelus australis]|uniref:Reverse transcriptase/retrotransposon-derived protein RNase H-like domain-containing protein n=1 Tax=Dryococelus australis TaxID=614101 RepID=A0ABQ9IBM8_9NEOP|nr:hypothetical protein PR048_006443 [Dryococelus australis]
MKMGLYNEIETKKAQCFNNVKTFPCKYTNNKRTWMTPAIFEGYVWALYAKMGSNNKDIAVHGPLPSSAVILNLINIKFEFFPPNSTPALQTNGSGVIKILKHQFRKHLLPRLINVKTSLHKINILEAMRCFVGHNRVKRLLKIALKTKDLAFSLESYKKLTVLLLEHLYATVGIVYKKSLIDATEVHSGAAVSKESVPVFHTAIKSSSHNSTATVKKIFNTSEQPASSPEDLSTTVNYKTGAVENMVHKVGEQVKEIEQLEQRLEVVKAQITKEMLPIINSVHGDRPLTGEMRGENIHGYRNGEPKQYPKDNQDKQEQETAAQEKNNWYWGNRRYQGSDQREVENREQRDSDTNPQPSPSVPSLKELAGRATAQGRRITSEMAGMINYILESERQVFSKFPGLNRKYECKLVVKEHKPLAVKLYPVPYTVRPAEIRVWGIEQQRVFEKLKEKLATAVLLHHPKLDQKLYIACNASDNAVGAVIFQYEDSEQKPIVFASRALSKAELNYNLTEKELLSAPVIEIWRKFILRVSKNQVALYQELVGQLNQEMVRDKKKMQKEWQWGLCIPDNLLDELYVKAHEERGHFWIAKTVKLIQDELKNVFCVLTKVPNLKSYGTMQPVLATEPFEVVTVDLFGPMPAGHQSMKYLLVVLDVASTKRKRHEFTLEEKLKILNEVDSRKIAKTEIARQFDFHSSSLSTIIKTMSEFRYMLKRNEIANVISTLTVKENVFGDHQYAASGIHNYRNTDDIQQAMTKILGSTLENKFQEVATVA